MPRSPARCLAPALLLGGLVACSSEDRKLHVNVTAGHETDTFTMDPPVTRITISAKSPDGSTAVVASTTPGGAFDLGDVVDTESVGFSVSGYDALGHLVVRGTSLGAISLLSTGTELTLPIFAQRVGQWARPPGELTRAHVNAPTGVLAEQYLWQSGGTAYDASGEVSAKASDFYDMLSLVGATGPDLDHAPETIVSFNQAAMLFDATSGTTIDFSAQTKGDLVLPDGLASFGDVAGGRLVSSEDGTSFLVGGTRQTGAPTRAVLIITSDGTLSATTLNTERLGATALWVPNLGLMVAGGSDTGAGVEVLPAGTTGFVAGGYPIDPVVGAAAVFDPRDTKSLKVLLVGGAKGAEAAPTRLLDLTCSTGCMPKELAAATLPLALTRAAAYVLSETSLFALGDEVVASGPGQTHTFTVDLVAGTVIESALREPRKGASAVPSPLGTLAMLGGVHLDGTPAFTMETFFPP